jgi:hypothetical protein
VAAVVARLRITRRKSQRPHLKRCIYEIDFTNP